jgi:hypothetical protein
MWIQGASPVFLLLQEGKEANKWDEAKGVGGVVYQHIGVSLRLSKPF